MYPLIRAFFFFLLLLLSIHGICQVRPKYVPFYYNGKAGFMDTAGKILKNPGLYAGNFWVVGDFKKYIGSEEDNHTDFIIDAVSGSNIFTGKFDKYCGPLKIDSITWYHFNIAGESKLIAPDIGTGLFLQKAYSKDRA